MCQSPTNVILDIINNHNTDSLLTFVRASISTGTGLGYVWNDITSNIYGNLNFDKCVKNVKGEIIYENELSTKTNLTFSKTDSDTYFRSVFLDAPGAGILWILEEVLGGNLLFLDAAPNYYLLNMYVTNNDGLIHPFSENKRLETAFDAIDLLLSQNPLIIGVASPVDISLVDPIGREIGAIYQNNTFIEEIDKITDVGIYTGRESEPEYIIILNPLEGIYDLQIHGVETGTYNLTIVRIVNNSVEYKKIYEAIPIILNHTHGYTIDVDRTPPNVTILTPINNTFLNKKEVRISWVATDNIGISGYEIIMNNVSIRNTTETNETFANLTEGLHIVELKAFDLVGNSASGFVGFTVDTIQPEINITGVKNGSYYGTEVSANVAVYDANLESSSVLLDGSPYTSGTVISSEGVHVLDIYADDKAGNNASLKITFTIDKTPPEVGLTSPINGSYVRDIVEINGLVTNGNLDRVSLNIDDVEVANALPYSWNTLNYGDGSHVVELIASDKANNSATDSISVTVDNTQPSITITSPLAKDYSYTADMPIQFTAADETSGLESVEADLNGNRVTNGQVIDLHNFILGEYVLTVKAIDKIGNNASRSVTFRIIDDVPPTSTDDADMNWHNTDITITMTALDEKSTVKEIHYAVNEGSEEVVSGSSANAAITYEDGNNTLRYYAVDEWGNIEAPRFVDGIKLDKTPPVVTLRLDPVREFYYSDEPLPVEYEAYDPVVTGTPSNELSLIFDIDGTMVENPTDLSGLGGSHTLILTAVDKAGNKGSASLDFNVVLRAEVNIDPDTLNLKSEGQWISAYIELPSQYDVMSIDINTVTLNRTVNAENDPKYDFVSHPVPVDKDGDGLAEFMVKFDRSLVESILEPADAVTLSVRGEFSAGIFEGSDTIRVIEKGDNNPINKNALRMNKHVERKGGNDNRARVRIDLFTVGNSIVDSVFVQEFIPEELGRDTSNGAFTGYGLMWDVGRIEQGKKQSVEYTLIIPEVDVLTTYALRTVVEYQTAEDIETIEEITYLVVEPDGEIKLEEGQGKYAIKEKGSGFTRGTRGKHYDRGGSSESHGKGRDKEHGRPDDRGRGNPPESPPGNPNPGNPDNPPENPNPGQPDNPNPPDNPGNPDHGPKR